MIKNLNELNDLNYEERDKLIQEGLGEFEKLIGKVVPFFGIDHEQCIMIADKRVNVVEDESDGYRSYLGLIEVEPLQAPQQLLDYVAVIQFTDTPRRCFDGYSILSATRPHVWLRFGTDHADDYYPYFVWEYRAWEGQYVHL